MRKGPYFRNFHVAFTRFDKGDNDMKQLPSVVQRFLRYVAYDTEASDESTTYPSTEKQKELGKVLVKELLELGLHDAAMDDYGYVIATLPGNISNQSVPVIGFISHVDTSPDMSGKDVKPQIHSNYQGGPIRLNDQYSITLDQSPILANHIGHTIITSDGTTLLGADDKAGIAEIMTMLEVLISDPSIRRGKIKVAFTCDEEVGGGTKYFDVQKFGAQYAYTVDGGGVLGEIENETFSADSAKIVFSGTNVHPGYAKGKLVNASKAASYFVTLFPDKKSPEHTEEREPYMHITGMNSAVEKATVTMILRAFDEEELMRQRKAIQEFAEETKKRFPKVGCEVNFSESYRNMKLIIDQHPEVLDVAMEAVKKSGMTPRLTSIRGGTDGATLSFKGLPTPNVFAGGNLFHSRFEWVAVEVMEQAVKTLVNIVRLWAERPKK